MAMITQRVGLVWFGETNNCTELDFSGFGNKIGIIYATTQSGVDSSDPLKASLGVGFSKLLCGSAYLINSKQDGLPYDITNAIPADLNIDGGRVDLSSVNLVERFVAPGGFSGASGTYIMTTGFFNNKPLYKNDNDWYAVYNADSTWSLKNSITQPTLEYKNNNVSPASGAYIQVDVGSPGPTTPTPTPAPVQVDAELLGRWDAQYASTDIYVEDPVGGYDIVAPSATIREDLSGSNRGKVFTMDQLSHFCRIGDILNETFHSANFSISFWCNPNTHVALDQDPCCYSDNCNSGQSGCRSSILASKWYSSPSKFDNSWLIYSNGSFVSDGSIKNHETSGGATATHMTKSIPINSNAWTHLLYSVESGKVTIYMNGEDVTGAGADLVHAFDLDCSFPIVLGNLQNYRGYPGRYGYRGGLDDFRIYDGPLSDSDAVAIYNSTDEESQRQPFNIPTQEVVETTLPMSDGIEVTKGFDIMIDPHVYGMSVVGDEIAVLVELVGGSYGTPEYDEKTPIIRFYKSREWPPTDPFDNDARYLRTEDAYVDISDFVQDVQSVKYIKWVKTENPTRNILIVCTETSGIRVYRKSTSGDSWVSSKIGVNWTSLKNKLEYIEYDSPTDDIIMILDSAGTMTSYRTASFGQWAIFGQESGVENVAVDGKKLVLSKKGPLDSDIYDLRLYDITSRDDIPGTSNTSDSFWPNVYQGTRESKALGLTIFGDDIYASFTGTQSSRFKFDPNDDYLPSASPSSVYRFPEVNMGPPHPTEHIIHPPYRLSGIDYDHVHNFGSGIHVNDKYMVITSNASDFAYLYTKSSATEWEFVSRLVYGVTSSTPECYIGEDYCIIHCGLPQPDQLVYFEFSNLTSDGIGETLPIVSDNLVAWWDFGSKYGRLPSDSHVVFDKSGYNNHLGVGASYETLATTEVPGAIDADKVYRFDSLPNPKLCKSPISNLEFTGDFTVSIWFYRTNGSNREVIVKRDTNSGPDFGTFTIYANGNMYMGDATSAEGHHQLTTPIRSDEWTFLTLVRDGMAMKSYINGQLSKSTILTERIVSSSELQVASQGNIGYLDDVKIYKKALTSAEIQGEFEKSYRHELLTA